MIEAAPFGRELIAELGLRGLHCGSGEKLEPGWLNTDVAPCRSEDGGRARPDQLVLVDGDRYYLRHDGRQPFPLEDETFEWAYAEHMIEHLAPGEAIAWLAEVRRLLRPGGYLRLTTPDLRKYARAYLDGDGFLDLHRERLTPWLASFLEPRNEEEQEMRRLYFPGEDNVPRRPGWMVNQVFYLWGHRWIYDPAEIRHAATLAGFLPDALVECAFREGREAEVCALDREVRSDESLYVEVART